MATYRVTEPCFYDGAYRTPDQNAVYTRQEPFADGECPRYMVLVSDEPSVYEDEAFIDDDADPVGLAVTDEGQDFTASDAAIDLAAEHGVNLSMVTGTGANGNITKPDVQAYIDARDEGSE